MVVIMKNISKHNMLPSKRFTYVSMIILIMILLSSCDYSYHLFYSEGKVVSTIELINYTHINGDEQIYAGEYDSNNIEVLEILDQTEIEVFIDELSKIGGISGKYKNIANNPCGFGILITYDDSSFTVITIDEPLKVIYLGEYDSESKVQDYFGIGHMEMIEDFNLLISNFFITTDSE